MKLKEIIKISGIIKLLSGLHIGAGDSALEIGGLDQPIIKHPITGEPYIPGSSLKGKIRSLLELKYGKFINDLNAKNYGGPCNCGNCLICKVFGVGASNKSGEAGPTRLLVRDAFMTEEWKEKFKNGELSLEIKYENTINRITGTAEHPRPLERVPAGVEFEFNMSVRIYDQDNEDEILSLIKQGMALLQLDALGGNGSRGCGHIEFSKITISKDSNKEDEEENLNDFLRVKLCLENIE